MKKAAFFFTEVLGFTLLLKAVASLLFGLPLNNMVAQVGLWFVFGFLILLLAWLLQKLLRGSGLPELGFRFHKSFTGDLWLGICGFAIVNLLSLPVDLAALRDRANMAHAIVEQLHLSSALQILAGGTLLAAALGFFTGAFHEEIRFRGYYQGTASAELTPLAGLLIGLIPFTLGHYFSHPDWSLAQVAATFVPGLIYGLLFYATRSLTVVMTAHTLSNVLPFFPFLLHEATGSRAITPAAIAALATLSLLLIALGWNHELRDWRHSTRQLFTMRPAFGLLTGLVIGGALLGLWLREFRPLYSSTAGVILLAIAFLGRSTKPK
jgi:membrane protease YdiL (CAAX protease family)